MKELLSYMRFQATKFDLSELVLQAWIRDQNAYVTRHLCFYLVQNLMTNIYVWPEFVKKKEGEGNNGREEKRELQLVLARATLLLTIHIMTILSSFLFSFRLKYVYSPSTF